MMLYLRQRLVNGESPQSCKLSFQVILQKCEDQATVLGVRFTFHVQ